MNRKTVLIAFLFMFIFLNISHAGQNPFLGLTEEQIVDKYFTGRKLDPIEGVWLDQKAKKQVIVKSGLIDVDDKYKNCDYIMLIFSSDKETVSLDSITKMDFPFCYSRNKVNLLRLLSPTTFHYENYRTRDSFFTRIYPIAQDID